MAQHDYVIANGTGAAVRSDLNNGLAAIVSNNSGATAPATTYAYQWWADTTTGLLKLRNSANSAWITLFQLDGEWSTLPIENGTAAAPSIYFKDSGTDTGFYSPGADQIAISTGGTSRLAVSTTAVSSTLAVDVPLGAVGTPSLTFTGDLNTGVFSPGADTIALVTGGTNRVHVTSGGLVGIGNNAPQYPLQTDTAGTGTAVGDNTAIYVQSQASGRDCNIRFGDSVNASARIGYLSNNLYFYVNGSERGRWDSSGRLLVGTSNSTDNIRLAQKFAVVSTGASNAGGAMLTSYSGTSPDVPSILDFQRSRGTTDGSFTAVATGDGLGALIFRGANGSAFANAAWIRGEVDSGTVSGSSMPGRLVFSTTKDAQSSPTEACRIDSSQRLLVGKGTADFNTVGISNNGQFGQIEGVANGNYIIAVNRLTNDGDLITFFQAGAQEGSISVSGTTVSYNGAHLSRWSQLPCGAERIEILRGSVLSNIDEMCEWTDEENEQLNRMKVSDVEGDKNVSGVFQTWDDDDDTYTDDFYCAMTGDFIIRIAEGVTVERGDLLMSAGDGTAKPQDDDIIRSKTIAKVTSTNVSCTYDDGSYCVPCVLMAC